MLPNIVKTNNSCNTRDEEIYRRKEDSENTIVKERAWLYYLLRLSVNVRRTK